MQSPGLVPLCLMLLQPAGTFCTFAHLHRSCCIPWQKRSPQSLYTQNSCLWHMHCSFSVSHLASHWLCQPILSLILDFQPYTSSAYLHSSLQHLDQLLNIQNYLTAALIAPTYHSAGLDPPPSRVVVLVGHRHATQ